MKDRMDRRRAKGHFCILFIGLFCLCAHLTITMREPLLTATHSWTNSSFLYMGLINKVDMVCLSPVGYGV